ncbi:helix-turn-helix transcriptional regulator [Rheinheimera maricola]|uniref:Response regulator transcription factor n=1 Tax=Rheinheimera maricola TaxID=2793282 RepID=A0ABS7X640_9GAMM|nr:response regulator transcription factor [Rheinheimera maricola]MBZ9610999.1 response regulator transcription factor [Rheinheimera maricola]
MDKFVKLIVLTEQDNMHNIAILAESVGINVQQQSRLQFQQTSVIKAGTLLACPYQNNDLNKKGISTELQNILQKAPLFFFQAERSLLNPTQALLKGVRGVIYRDEQLDRVLTALRTMMDGQLYYARPVMSTLLDELLRERLHTLAEPGKILDNNLLTRQEKKIIQLVAEGARNKEIADNLNISAHTVKAHMSAIFRKTQARNRVELLRWLQQPGRTDHPASLRFS